MYTPTQLVKINTSRTTIYNKLKHKTLQEFIIETKQGKQLIQERLNQSQILLLNEPKKTKSWWKFWKN